jgi:hypothetical protein
MDITSPQVLYYSKYVVAARGRGGGRGGRGRGGGRGGRRHY